VAILLIDFTTPDSLPVIDLALASENLVPASVNFKKI
jgi:hypothetical protein